MLLVAVPAAAAPPRALDAALEAGKACQAKDREGAIRSLEALVSALESELGSDHDATRLARMTLSQVRGEKEPSEPQSGGSHPPTPPKLEEALKGLRACSALRDAKASPSEQGTGAGFQESLDAAGRLFAKGSYRQALEPAQAAMRVARGPSQIMQANETLASIQLEFGNRAAALRAAQDAEAAARISGAIKVRIKLARLLARTGDLSGAAAALASLELLGSDNETRAAWLEARGELSLLLGSPVRAVSELKQAFSAYSTAYGAESVFAAFVEQLLGDASRQAGDFPAASRAYAHALRIFQANLGPRHPQVASTENAIGVLDANLEDWQGADASFSSALSILEESFGPDHPDAVRIRLSRARVAWGATPNAETARAYRSSVEQLSRSLGDDHPEVAAARRSLAKMEAASGRLDEAQKLLEKALEAQQRRLGEDDPETAVTRLERGRLLASRGAFDRAAAEIQAAIGSLEKSVGSDDPDLARYRAILARVAVARGDDKTAVAEALEAARVLELHLRHSLGALTDRQRMGLAEQSQEVVGALLSVPGAPARQVYAALLPQRDSALRSSAAAQALLRKQGGPTRAALDQLMRLRERYAASVAANSPEAARLAREIDSLEAQAEIPEISLREPDPSSVLEAACKRLPADAAVVEFVAFDGTRRGVVGAPLPSYAAAVIRAPSCDVTIHSLGDAASLEAAAQRFDQAMREQRADEEDALRELGKRLFDPIKGRLRGASSWLVIPDGRLWGVPIGALPDPEDSSRYVLERVTVAYLTSLYELAEAPEQAREGGLSNPLLLGAPDFGAVAGKGPVVITSTGPCELAAFDPLPGALGEIESVASLLATPRVVTGPNATRQRFYEELARRPGMIHLATHGYFAGHDGCESKRARHGLEEDSAPIDPDPLLRSGIVLAGANKTARVGEGGGILTSYEIARLDLGTARLVVLSACDTGTGSERRGQEVQGLRWAFRAAGAHALVTSVWTSNDAVTRELMHDFYAALGSSGAPGGVMRGAQALRHAQLARVEDDRRLGVRRPLLWANFVFSGVL